VSVFLEISRKMQIPLPQQRLNNEAALFHMKVTETICWETTAFHVEFKNTRYLSRDPIWAA